MRDVIKWSWEGPENPYWMGTHADGDVIGCIEYFETPTPRWYFCPDDDYTFGALTMSNIIAKLLELESGMERISSAVVHGFNELMETDEMKEFFGEANQ